MRDYELKLVDSSRLLADILVSDVGTNTEHFREMLDLCYHDKYPVSMRAARVIALVTELHPELVHPYVNEIILKLSSWQTEGLRRSFLKILSEISYSYNEDQLGILTDLAFTWLTDPKEAIAIRYYSIAILLIVSKKYPEIKGELSTLLNELAEDSSSGLKTKSVKVLNYLKKL